MRQKNDGEYILLTEEETFSGIKSKKTELGIKMQIKNSLQQIN
jgi:hypothetical protein